MVAGSTRYLEPSKKVSDMAAAASPHDLAIVVGAAMPYTGTSVAESPERIAQVVRRVMGL